MEKHTVVLSVKCPHCGANLMDDSKKVNGLPGIKLNLETEHGKGVIWLCAIYDCFDHVSSIELKDKELVKLFCPHCNKSLLREILCKICDAPIAGMNLKAGGKVNICSRKECNNHYVLFEDINDALNLFYDKFESK